MKTILLGLSLFLVIFTQSGCQTREEQETRQQALSRGFSLMDENNYDDAITYFESMLEKDRHYHVRIALVSAYAGRAGVKIEQIYSFAVVKNVAAPEVDLQGVTVDSQTKRTLHMLAQYAEQWDRVPEVDGSRREDLQAALEVLDGELEPGARLYAGALRIVILKSSIVEGLKNFSVQTAKKICTKDMKPYALWAARVIDELREVVLDLEFAFPEQKKNYEETRMKLEVLRDQVATFKFPQENKCY